jgi:hypothetical protein
MSILAWIEDRRKQKLKSGLDRTPGNQASPDEVKGYGHVVTHVVLFFTLNI